MSGRARVVVRLGVGSELGAALRARPGFRRGDQLSPHATAPRRRFDEPALEITHSIGSTALGVRANGNLGEGYQAGLARGDQDGSGRTRIREKPVYLLPVLGLRSVRP